MATGSTINLETILEELEKRANEVPNDERQQNYCNYCNMLTSNYGNERVYLVGSTKERTRIRSNEDEGDYDYLLVSDVGVPVELLEYRSDVPCFVHIDGKGLQDKFKVKLIDGKHLPSELLKSLSPEAFTVIRGIVKMVTAPATTKGRNTFHVSVNIPNKLGLTLEEYAGFECKELPEVHQPSNSMKAGEMFLQGCSNSNIITKNKQSGTENDVQGAVSKIMEFAEAIRQPQIEYEKDVRQPQDVHVESNFYQNLGLMTKAIHDNESSKRAASTGTPSTCTKDLHGGEEVNIPSTENKKVRLESSSSPQILDTETESINNPSPLLDKEMDTEFTASTNGASKVPLSLGGITGDEETVVKFRSKSHKDFTGALRLLGKPKELDEWRKRPKKWLTEQQVDDIYNSEFYVVGKPAIVNPDEERDFCLSYNQAEIKLAKAMSRGQRRCLLMLKAFQRTTLKEFSDALTSFHWKTALYWKSEEIDPILFDSDLIMKALKQILEYMIHCLCERQLSHYFVRSNLFAALDEEISEQIIYKLMSINEDPLAALKTFLEQENNFHNKFQTEKLPRSKLEEIKRACYEAKEEEGVKNILSAIEDIARAVPQHQERKPNQRDFNEVLMSIGAVAFQDMMKEKAREKEKEAREKLERQQKEVRDIADAARNISVPLTHHEANPQISDTTQPRKESQHNMNQTDQNAIMNIAESFLNTVTPDGQQGESSRAASNDVLGHLRDFLSTPDGNRRERRENLDKLKSSALSMLFGGKK